MISHINSSVVTTAYQTQTKNNEVKTAKQNAEVVNPEDSRFTQIKESVTSGMYKVDIDALSKKIAESLL